MRVASWVWTLWDPVVAVELGRLIDDLAFDIDLDRKGLSGDGGVGSGQFKAVEVGHLATPIAFQGIKGAVVKAHQGADEVFGVVARVDSGIDLGPTLAGKEAAGGRTDRERIGGAGRPHIAKSSVWTRVEARTPPPEVAKW